MAIKQPRDHLKRLPTRAELESAGIKTPEPGEARPEHPLLTASRQIGQELARYGVAWGFGVSVQTNEMRPAIFAEAAAQILVAKGICTPEEWDDVVYTLMHKTMTQVLEAVKKQRPGGLVLPDGTPAGIPPDLLAKKMGRVD
jgi:hypothetical protein